jgi:carbon monoxide dehydrogenase subunit G
MKLQRTIAIQATPEAVYDLLMDPTRLGDWVTIQQSLKDPPAGPLKQGSYITQRLRVAGTSFDVRWKVLEARRPEHVVWEGRGPWGSQARTIYDLQPGGNQTTVFCYENEYKIPGGPLGELAGRALKTASGHEADLSLDQFKRLVEDQ